MHWISSKFRQVHLDLSYSRKFKGGIGSLFDPVLTLWGGGHIGSSRMEQSYCTSGYFRQCVTARNHSNYQPTPRRRSITAYGKCENARCHKCVPVCVICFIFLAALFYAFQTFPGKAQLFSRFFPLCFKCCDWHVWSPNVSGASEDIRYDCILYRPTVSFYLLITLFWLFYMEFACIKSMCSTLFILFMIGLHYFSKIT